MREKQLKIVGTVLAVCLCATACGSTASTTTEDNTVNSGSINRTDICGTIAGNSRGITGCQRDIRR